MINNLSPLPPGSVKLLPGLFQQRYNLNRRYMLSLKTENLLQNHYMEAGLWMPRTAPGGHPLGLGVAHLPAARAFPRPLALGGAHP